MKLKTDDLEVGYSPAEREVFDLLSFGERQSISSKELVEKRYGASAPYHALSIVRAVVDSLSRKIEFNKEPFRLEKSDRHGPYPIYYWLEKKR